MIKAILIIAISLILFYFLFPAFFELAKDIVCFVNCALEDIQDAFIETKHKWKELFSRWLK